MTKEDVDSSEKENGAAAVSNDNDILIQTEDKANGVTNAESNGAQSHANKSESNSPQPHGIQNNEDAADADEKELIRRMRADAVDNTMYSKKFILQTMP